MATLTRDQLQLKGIYNSFSFFLQDISGNTQLAQTFIPSVTGNLNKVSIVARKTGTPSGDLVIEIRTTSGGSPTATVLATQNVTVGSVVDKGITTFTFSSPPALTSGTKYAICVHNADGLGGSPSATNYYSLLVSGSGEDYYGSGINLYYSSDGGSSWNAQDVTDFAFATEMSVATAGPGLDQFSFVSSNGEFITSNTTEIAQTFVPSVNGNLNKIKLHINRIDGQTGGNVTFEIKAVDGSNKPTGSALATQNVTDSSIPSAASNSALTVTFGTAPTLVSGTTYAIVVSFPNANGSARYNLFVLAGTDANMYTSGRQWKSTDTGSTWGDGVFGANSDMGFATFMDEIATATQTISSNATVQTTSTQTIFSDAFAGQVSTQTVNSNATVGGTSTQTINSGGFVGSTTTQTVNSAATIQATVTQTVNTDAKVQATSTQNINSNANVLTTTSQYIAANAAISIPITQTILSGAIIIVNEPVLKLFIVV